MPRPNARAIRHVGLPGLQEAFRIRRAIVAAGNPSQRQKEQGDALMDRTFHARLLLNLGALLFILALCVLTVLLWGPK
jgi:hypothetical protein